METISCGLFLYVKDFLSSQNDDKCKYISVRWELEMVLKQSNNVPRYKHNKGFLVHPRWAKDIDEQLKCDAEG